LEGRRRSPSPGEKKVPQGARVGARFGVIGPEKSRLDFKLKKLLRGNLNKLETSQIFQ
jgi:hypothetical protein